MGKGGALLREWWPPLALLAAILALQAMWTSGYDVEGHAAGHLSSATGVFSGVFIVGVILWATPARGRRDPLLAAALVAVFVGYAFVVEGNLTVVDAIGDRSWTDEEAGALGASLPGFEAGHRTAGTGALSTVAAAIATALVLRYRKLVSTRATVASIAVSVVVPSWIWPGAGLVVLAGALCRARARSRRTARSDQLPGAGAPSVTAAAPWLRTVPVRAVPGSTPGEGSVVGAELRLEP